MTGARSRFVVPAVHDDRAGPLFEIVAGRRVVRHRSLYECVLAANIGHAIGRHVGDGAYVVTHAFIAAYEDWRPDTRRRPDVSYWRHDQFPDGIARDGDAAVAAAFVCELIGHDDAAEAVAGRVADHLRAGTPLVWVVHPLARTIRAERPDGAARVYREHDTITAAPVLPGFSVVVAELFPPVADG